MKCPKSEDFLEFTPSLYAMNGILQGNTHSVEQPLTSPNCLAVTVDYGSHWAPCMGRMLQVKSSNASSRSYRKSIAHTSQYILARARVTVPQRGGGSV